MIAYVKRFTNEPKAGLDPVVRHYRLRRGDVLKRVISLGVLLAIVSLAAVACGGVEVPTATPQRASPPPPPPAPVVIGPPSEEAGDGADLVDQPGTEVTVINQDPGGSGQYQFAPNELTFSVGEVVIFRLSAETEFHTFTVDELGIDVALDVGAPETLTFKFDQPGTFRLICVPHELQGMVGTITVQ